MKTFKALQLAIVGVLAWSATASAVAVGTINFTNSTVDLTGTGKGRVLGVLSVRDNDPPGGDGAESGAARWTSIAPGIIPAGHVFQREAVDTSHFFAQKVADLLLNQIIDPCSGGVCDNTFSLVLQVNEAQNPKTITVRDFGLDFFSAAGASLGTAGYDAPAGGLVLSVLQATGQGTSGWLFTVVLDQAFANSFFSNPNNRVGGFILLAEAILNAEDGADNFFLTSSEPGTVPPGEVIPEPSTLLLLGSGLAGLGWLRGRRAKKA